MSVTLEEVRGEGPAFEYSDWASAFEVSSIRSATPWDKSVKLSEASNKDVVEVLFAENGENDGDHWIGIFRLKDGRYVSISAWCDYTGWGCQDGGEMMVANSREEILRYGLSDAERKRLGIPLSEAVSE